MRPALRPAECPAPAVRRAPSRTLFKETVMTPAEPLQIEIAGHRLGGERFTLIAGPCTVESREQTLETAAAVRAAGGTMFRGGAYKPRSSPRSFQGLGRAGLRLLAEAKAATGLPIVTECVDVRDLDQVLEVADLVQVGARNMQNYALLTELGRAGAPVLLKRGLSATLDELLQAAEYVLAEGNERVVLCERGIRTFETAYRFTLDLAAIPVLKERTSLPVIVDPSHAAGRRELVDAAVGGRGRGGGGRDHRRGPSRPGRRHLRWPAVAADRRPGELRRSGQGRRRAGRQASGPASGPGGGGVAVSAAAPHHRQAVRDQRIERLEPLVSPGELLSELPLSDGCAETVLGGRAQVHAVLDGEDDRLLVVVGPCSVHDVDATLDYARRLAALIPSLSDDLLIVMRVYFEKPRTTTGWKGLINDPHLDGSGDVNAGLRLARRLLLDVLAAGVPIGCEFLDPITPQYISDAVCWGAIGARTTESQIHRQLGSGLSMPVGFKNGTDGGVQVAVDAVRAAAVPHAFAGIDLHGRSAIVHTRGNRDCHVILRGGRAAPNHAASDVAAALTLLRAARLPERVMIDLSHDNSRKQPERQPTVAADLAAQLATGQRAIVGTMLESFLVGGRQELRDPAALVRGQSITDGCLGWEETVAVLERLAAAAAARRRA